MRTQAADTAIPAQPTDARVEARPCPSEQPDRLEAELRRIAFDLHDGPAQAVAAASLMLDGALETDDIAVTLTQVARAREVLLDATVQLREVMEDLQPPEFAAPSLSGRLAGLVSEYERRYGIGVTLKVRGPVERIPAQMQHAVFRILQEALTNVRRHSFARSARAEVDVHDGVLMCRVADEGCGFDAGSGWRGGLGVASMRERASACGGDLLVLSSPGAGTTVEATWPVVSP
jgi:signal transduction histidine kinase